MNQISFGEVAEFRNGLNYGKDSYGKGYLLIGIPDFKDRFKPEYKSLGEINPIDIIKEEDYLNKYDIIFVRSNGNKALVGRSLFIDRDIKAVFSGFCIRARLTSQMINPLFCAYFTRTDRFKSSIASAGGTSIQNLNQRILANVKLPLFSIKTQNQITKVLADLDAKIEVINKVNQELEAMAKTVYDYWFVQFDFPDANGKSYKSSGGLMLFNEELKREIPEGWEMKKFGDIIKQVSDGIEPDEFPELKYLPIDKLPTQKLYYQEYESRVEANSSLIKFKENDILLGAMRVHFHRVCHAIEDGISRSTMMVFRPYNSLNKNYALFTLNRNETIEYATKNSTGTSIPYAKWNGNLAEYKLCFPSDEKLLTKFNEVVDPILENFKTLSKQSQKLSELRDWLLPMLMNGQITFGGAEKEMESLGLVAEEGIKYGEGIKENN